MGSKKKAKITSVKIVQVGSTGTEVYATWKALSSTIQKYVDKINITWNYRVKNRSGNYVWLTGSTTTASKGASRTGQTYTAPDTASGVSITIKPSLTKKGKKKYTASSTTEYYYDFRKNKPDKPSAPEVNIDGYKLTASISTNDELADYFKFFIYTQYKNGTVSSSPTISSGYIKTSSVGTAEYVHNLTSGYRYYVTCKAYNLYDGTHYGSEESDPSQVSESPIPKQVTGVKVETISNNQVKLDWNDTKGAATENGYEVEYATKVEYFNTDNAQIISANESHAFITLDIGNVWYFRVRAKNSDDIPGAWSAKPYVSAAAAIKPNPPTTWSLKSSAMINDTMSLYWTHNSADGSKPTRSHLVYQINDGEEHDIYVDHSDLKPDDTDFTFHYDMIFDQETFSDGDIFKWKVATTGIAEKGESDFSMEREIKIYAPVTVGIDIGTVITEYPMNIIITAEPSSQNCVACYVTITANNDYESEDYMGNARIIHSGDTVYSQIFTNIENELTLSLLPTDVNLADNQTYTIRVDAAMTSSLSGTSEQEFEVDLEPLEFDVDAGIIVDSDSLTAGITPSCTYTDDNPEHPPIYRNCSETDVYNEDEIYYIDNIGTIADPQPTEAEYTLNPSSYYVIEPVLVESVKMDVYRINFDGTFTEIASGLDNTGSVMVTDPHPALDNAKYRIIGHDTVSGSLFYDDVISEDIEQPGLVLQWDANYTDVFENINVDEIEKDAIGSSAGGTTLILPYNVKTSEASTPDVAVVEYIGRQSPTTYYGTQTGQNGTLSADVDKEDTKTLELLRRLQIWMGDVYVRERDGLGYWAKVDVSFNRDYGSLVMPVSFSVQRVDSKRP